MKNHIQQISQNNDVRLLIYCGMASLLFSAVVPALMLWLVQLFSH
jgi:hypothetical protein